ncbi:MAG: threonine ammonia-lyase [Clostridioides sp.]|jgi:threonine dehydratase|nr:threonine ammonia-lyase [Clostridioides sp.]
MDNTKNTVSLEDVKKAQETIKNIVKRTDLLESAKLSEKTGATVYYKCENLQRTGSFKLRGACNKIANLTEEEKACGVIASSAGNHAQGVAYGATMSGIKSTICMPATAPLAKVTATKKLGAEVILEGVIYDDAYAKAVQVQKETGATFLHPYDDKYVIAGQGTIGLEILDQLNGDVDVVLCPIGGGGLISGISTAIKSINPNTKIIGVQTANVPSMQESLKNGKVTPAFNDVTIADGIQVKTPGNITFDIVSKLVDEVITVTEEEIADAILYMLEDQKVVAEGSGAVPVAAILSGKFVPEKDKKVVCVISGGNIDINVLYRVMGVALARQGRRFSFKVLLEDKPGNFSKLASLISEKGGNILTVNQGKVSTGEAINKQSVEFTLETTGFDHIEILKTAMTEEGFQVIEYK